MKFDLNINFLDSAPSSTLGTTTTHSRWQSNQLIKCIFEKGIRVSAQ